MVFKFLRKMNLLIFLISCIAAAPPKLLKSHDRGEWKRQELSFSLYDFDEIRRFHVTFRKFTPRRQKCRDLQYVINTQPIDGEESQVIDSGAVQILPFSMVFEVDTNILLSQLVDHRMDLAISIFSSACKKVYATSPLIPAIMMKRVSIVPVTTITHGPSNLVDYGDDQPLLPHSDFADWESFRLLREVKPDPPVSPDFESMSFDSAF